MGILIGDCRPGVTGHYKNGDPRAAAEGQARYYSLCIGERCVTQAVWCYPEPYAGFLAIRNYLAFYPDRVECYVGRERARAQSGGYYGGWITDEIVGPFKGEPGTSGW